MDFTSFAQGGWRMNLYELYQTYVKEYHITLTYEEFVKQYKEKEAKE